MFSVDLKTSDAYADAVDYFCACVRARAHVCVCVRVRAHTFMYLRMCVAVVVGADDCIPSITLTAGQRFVHLMIYIHVLNLSNFPR